MKNRQEGPEFYSEPHIQFLSQVLADLGRGQLLIPRFQRPFVWRIEQKLELLHSVRLGIPIGSIMVWRTAHTNVACYESLGPFPIKVSSAPSPRQYLLDGVQRLSTLYGALHFPEKPPFNEDSAEEGDGDGDGDGFYPAMYDLRKKDFFFLKHGEKAEDHCLPLSILLNSIELLRYQRKISHLLDAEDLINESERISSAFRQYKIPLIPIATDDFGLATLTFQRVNSQGQKMSEYHMIHALTWSSSFDLMQSIERLRHEVLSTVGWDALDEDPIIKVTKAALGFDLYKSDTQELSDAIKSRPGVIDEGVSAIADMATFLKGAIGIPSPEFVPYSLQTVLVSDIFRRFAPLTAEQKSLLVKWFWFITYGEIFTGISDDRLRIVMEDLGQMLKFEKPVWNSKVSGSFAVQRSRYDFRSVRTKSFILYLARMLDEFDNNRPAENLLKEYGRRSVQQLIPAAWLPAGKRHVFSSFGNRFIASPELIVLLRSELSWSIDLQKCHGVSEKAAQYLRAGDYVEFIEYRALELYHGEESFAVQAINDYLNVNFFHRSNGLGFSYNSND